MHSPLRDHLDLFLAKIGARDRLSEQELAAFHALPQRATTLSQRTRIVQEGERSTQCCMVQSGIAVRYKLSEAGRRQITSFHIPGDMVDLQTILFRTADHNIEGGRNTTIVMIPHEAVLALAQEWPGIARALWFDTLVDAAIQRETMLNIGRRDAMARTCHLLCELFVRYRRIGRVIQSQVDLALTQTELADGLGMTPIHLNRVIARLRRDGLITLEGRLLTVHDFDALRGIAGFDPQYLQLGGPDPLRI